MLFTLPHIYATTPTSITSPMPGDIVTTQTPTITGFTDPGNQAVNVIWDDCGDGCHTLLGSATVNPTTGAWTFTPTTAINWHIGDNLIIGLGVLNGVEEGQIFSNEVRFTFTPNPGFVHGMKWNDANANGIKDPGELGVAGVDICLEHNLGVSLRAEYVAEKCTPTMADDPLTPQDETGMYSLSDIPGSFIVYEKLPTGKAQTFPLDGQPHFVDIVGGQTAENIDFGDVQAAEIHGTKWSDSNQNGIRDAGELGISGVSICLNKLTPPDTTGVFLTCTQTMVDDLSTAVDETGMYSFTNLLPGFYRDEESVQLGSSQTFPANGEPHFVTLGIGQILQGVDFGNTQVPPGAISGTKFNDLDGNGIQDPGEAGVPNILICNQPLYMCTTTDANGNYLLAGVPAGTQQVYESIGGNINTTPLFQTVTVVSGQTLQNVNFGNQLPTPPPPEVTITGGSGFVINGLPVVHYQSTTTYTKDVTAHCGGSDPTSIQLTIGPFGDTPSLGTVSGAMTQVGSSKIWTATFGPFIPHHGTAALTFDVTCPGGAHEIQKGGNIYVDPSGTITDSCTGLPILGATATVRVESPPGSGNFVDAPATSPPIIPATNPETTLADGMYGWMAIPGTYEVTADAAGYVSQTTVPVTVPPEVTGLNISLTPTAGCKVDTVIALTSSLNPSFFGQSVDLTTAVSPAAPSPNTLTGSVEFLDSATSLGTVPLDATGHATFTTSGLTVGPHDITAKYSGDSNFNPITALLTQTVNPDTTPPEAYNQFDPTTKNVLVFGRDGESGVPPGPVTPLSVIPTNLNDDGDKQGSNDQSGDKKEHDDQSNAELRTYLISDLAGNSLKLVEKVKKEGHEIKVKIVSLQYNNGPIIASSKNEESFDWSLNTDGSLKKLDQEMKVGKVTNQKEVEAKYDGKKNKTTIELEKPKPETKIVKDGLVLLRMATSNGNLNIEIPP